MKERARERERGIVMTEGKVQREFNIYETFLHLTVRLSSNAVCQNPQHLV